MNNHIPHDPDRWACSSGHIHKNQQQADACDFNLRINALVERLERAIENAENPPDTVDRLWVRGFKLGESGELIDDSLGLS